MSLASGARLGHLEIVGPLGTGGMGEVFLARDQELNRAVAVKVLPPDVTSDPGRVARFEQEARAASALNHSNVCVVYALGRTEDGRRYMAMEHVEGETLRQRLRGGPLPLREALDVAIQIASALTAAHAAGIVHRDIKPENVMIRRDRLVKVLDFGLAKLVATDPALAAHEATRTLHVTEPGSLVGTTSYMAPEQARGQAVDARADVWALGVVLYEMATGRPPFTGDTRSDVLAAILEREPKPLTELDSGVPRELQRIAGKALRKDPDERYQVMKDLLLDLKALREELTSTSSSSSPAVAAAPARRRASASLLIGVAALAAVLLVAGAFYWRTAGSAAPDDDAPETSASNFPYTRLTFGSGLQTDPAFSPDGRFIAYASDRAGNFDIWVQTVGGTGEPVQVTRSPAQDTQPAWSPDGTILVFRSERDGGGLFVVPALGGPERRLTSIGQSPSWTPDGKEILFQVGNYPSSRALGSTALRLYAIAPEGGTPRTLIPAFLEGGAWLWLGGHPDGRISALGEHRSLGLGFFTVSRDGLQVVTSRQRPLGSAPAAWPSRFEWNRTGTMLFIEATSNVIRSLWRVRVDPGSLEWLSADRLTTASGQDVAPSVSVDGERVAFTRQDESTRLWIFPFEPGQRPRVGDSRTAITEDGAFVEFPAFSPDGRTLAYSLRRAGIDRMELWTAALDGERLELLATDTRHACWSRDGTKVAYMRVQYEPQPIRAATAYRELRGTEHFVSPWSSDFAFAPTDWSPDGRFLLGSFTEPVATDKASLALWSAVPSEGRRPDRILLPSSPTKGFWQGTFSPNGRWISFTTSELPGPVGIGVIAADAEPGASWTRIAADHAWADKPRWSPDGRALIFASRDRGPYFNLWAVGFDAESGRVVGEPFALTAFDSPGLMISPYFDSFEISISRTHAVIPMLTATGSIWMLENVDQ